jgi:carboxyl-terminal processing protease
MKSLRNGILLLILVILSIGLGYEYGRQSVKSSQTSSASSSLVINQTAKAQKDVDFSLFWDVWDRLSRTYVDKKKLDPQKMVYGAISGMVSSLDDPYTVFLPPQQNKDAKDDLGGIFEGIGAQLGIKDKKIIVIAPLKDSPAEKAGLKSGDWIIKVDNQSTVNWTLPETVSKIRGQKGTKVTLTIMQKDASSSSDLQVMRGQINVASVLWEIKNAQCAAGSCVVKQKNEPCTNCVKVVYLNLSRFGDQTNTEWSKAIGEIENYLSTPSNESVKGLVFDLRNNPGGYLASSIFIASEFLPDGTVVIQESSDGNQQKYTVNRKGTLLKIPVVVLINKGSASASEIVAGALKDRGRAILVGETSFGKGTIQDAQELPGGAGIHITTAKWLLPSGKWINGTGLEPDIKSELDDKKPDEDLQLESAIQSLVK